jgi:hypothetical protein
MGAGFWYLSSTQVLPTSVQESPACRIARFWPLVTSRVLISYGSVLALTLPFLTTTVVELSLSHPPPFFAFFSHVSHVHSYAYKQTTGRLDRVLMTLEGESVTVRFLVLRAVVGPRRFRLNGIQKTGPFLPAKAAGRKSQKPLACG